MTVLKETIKPETIRRRFEGVVATDCEQKTVHVVVKMRKMHEKYKKQYTTSRKYAVHDEKGLAHAGDTISFEECRPLSKTKRWRIVDILKKAS